MPLYDFQCSCGLRFQKKRAASQALTPAPCPDCKAEAPRAVSQGVGIVMGYAATSIQPQNTGVLGFDADIDRVIGSSAQLGWQAQSLREGEKDEVLRLNPGAESVDITANPDHSWGVLPASYRIIRKNAAVLNNAAIKKIRESRDGSSSD